MNWSDKLTEKAISTFRSESDGSPGRNVELEIRLKDITREAFESVYTAILASPAFQSPTLECSLNIVSKNIYEDSSSNRVDDTSYIRKVVFREDPPAAQPNNVAAQVGAVARPPPTLENPHTSYIKKNRLMSPVFVNGYIKYTIGLSSETVSEEFRTNSKAILRFRVRVSFIYVGVGSGSAPIWRFDLTAVKQGNMADLGKSIKDIKRNLFVPALNPKNLLEHLNYNLIDAYEIEIEYIGDPKTASTSDLKVVDTLFSLINPTYLQELVYQEEIYTVAEYLVENKHILPQFKQSTHRLKQLANQVIALSKNTYYSDVFPPIGYYLTEKADGLRCIVHVRGSLCRILLSDKMIEIGSISSAADQSPNTPAVSTVVDCELIGMKDGKDLSIHIFDCMVLKGENITQRGFEERVTHLAEAAAIIDAVISKQSSSPGAQATPTFHVHPKKFVCITKDNIKDAFSTVWNTKHPYTIDGEILTEPGQTYSQTKNYKWKPYERTTIDFLAMKCPKMGVAPYLKKEGYELYLLFVGINHNMREKLGLGLLPFYRDIFPPTDNSSYYPIQFAPSANPLAYLYYHPVGAATQPNNVATQPNNVATQGSLHRKIIELGRDADNLEWVFHIVREDRKMESNYFGNDYKIAELTYLNYIDPFPIENLSMESMGYFTKSSSDTADIYSAPNKYKRFVISIVLKDTISNAKWIIDEASGRGADLHRYQKIGVENAIFIDIDPIGITELVRRKFEFFAIKQRNRRERHGRHGAAENGGNDDPTKTHLVTAYDKVHGVEYDRLITKDVKSLTIHTIVADLKTPADEMIMKTYPFGVNPGMVDGIICNFALHYMCDSQENLRNLLAFNNKMLRPQGVFMFTVMNGRKIFDLLKKENVPVGGQWEVRESGLPKYAIRRKYTGDTFANVGQMISVLLSFNNQMLDEPLCSIENVIETAESMGFSLERNESLDVYLEQFKHADRGLYERLTKDDLHYINLHHFITLRKITGMKETKTARVRRGKK